MRYTGLFHSDRGSQYAADDYRDALSEAGMTCSMSRRGRSPSTELSDHMLWSKPHDVLPNAQKTRVSLEHGS